MFFSPRGVAVPQGTWPVTVYVSDTSNSLVRAISPAGWVSTLAGTVSMPGYVDGAPGTTARLNAAAALWLDPLGNRLILADANNNRVRALTCVPCPASFYCASGAPVLCPAGSYCPLSTVDATPCPAGTWSNATGASSIAACANVCPAGSFSSGGATACGAPSESAARSLWPSSWVE
jgi:hypothetical protein